MTIKSRTCTGKWFCKVNIMLIARIRLPVYRGDLSSHRCPQGEKHPHLTVLSLVSFWALASVWPGWVDTVTMATRRLRALVYILCAVNSSPAYTAIPIVRVSRHWPNFVHCSLTFSADASVAGYSIITGSAMGTRWALTFIDLNVATRAGETCLADTRVVTQAVHTSAIVTVDTRAVVDVAFARNAIKSKWADAFIAANKIHTSAAILAYDAGAVINVRFTSDAGKACWAVAVIFTDQIYADAAVDARTQSTFIHLGPAVWTCVAWEEHEIAISKTNQQICLFSFQLSRYIPVLHWQVAWLPSATQRPLVQVILEHGSYWEQPCPE